MIFFCCKIITKFICRYLPKNDSPPHRHPFARRPTTFTLPARSPTQNVSCLDQKSLHKAHW